MRFADDVPTVVVIGSVNLDVVLRVAALPHPGETVHARELTRLHGGKGGNQAAAAAALGARTILVGQVGADTAGTEARAALAKAGVDVRYVTVEQGRPTGTAIVMVEDGGENTVTVAAGANASLSVHTIQAAMAATHGRATVVLASLEVPMDAVVAAAEVARKRNWSFILNPAPAVALPPHLLGITDVLTPNQHELAVLGDGSADALLALGVGAVVVTRGAEGTVTYQPGAEPVRRQAYHRVRVLDTTGAGDAFNGALAWAMAAGRSLPDAVGYASVAGALATRGVGARSSLASGEELLAAQLHPR